MKNILLAIIGIAMLVTGITFVLVWWPSVVAVFQGVFGGTLAVLGLIVIYLATSKTK